MRHLLTAFFILLLNAVPAACADPLPVVASIAPQKYILERIAGNYIAVTVFVKPGADPHAYEPTPSQMRTAADAACWFTIGVPFEDVWLPRISGASGKELPTVSFIRGIHRLPAGCAHAHGENDAHSRADHADDEHGDHAHEGDEHDGEDPHVWLSPMLVREMLSTVTRELGRLLPERAAEFRANAAAFADELETLDGRLAGRFNEFPAEDRVFLTIHPSWRYFAYNYGLTELSIEIGGKEPGPRSLKGVIDAAGKHRLRTVFVEPQFPKSSAEAVAAAIGANIVEADPLAENIVENYTSMADKLIDSFRR